MPDDSLWKRLISGGGQRVSRILGRRKPVPIESSHLETLPNEPAHKIIAAGNEKTAFGEPWHARMKNLIYAEAAVKHVEEKLFLGSTNRQFAHSLRPRLYYLLPATSFPRKMF